MEKSQKITMSALIALLAMKSGDSKEKSEKFIESFFSLIADTLQTGESVKIKGLGTFKVVPVENRKSVNISDGSDITIPGHNKVVFIPAREIAEKINAPFSMFDSVELVSKDVMEPNEIEEIPIQSGELEVEDMAPESSKDEVKRQPEKMVVTEEEEKEENAYIVQAEHVEKRKGGVFRFLMGFACGLAAAIILILGGYYFFLKDYLRTPLTKEIQKTEAPLTDASAQVEMSNSTDEIDTSKTLDGPATEPSQMLIYDTIGRQRYLTTMAQDHYGSFNLWPYIYEENKSFLGHPDRIKPGTRVVIPNLEKYGVDPGNPKDIKAAKAKGVEIYNRYK